eukprot:7870961-Pyramimonas_sp.AAC.1
MDTWISSLEDSINGTSSPSHRCLAAQTAIRDAPPHMFPPNRATRSLHIHHRWPGLSWVQKQCRFAPGLAKK